MCYLYSWSWTLLTAGSGPGRAPVYEKRIQKTRRSKRGKGKALLSVFWRGCGYFLE